MGEGLLLGGKGGRNGGECGAGGGCMGDEMCGRVVAQKENFVIWPPSRGSFYSFIYFVMLA